MKNPERTLVRPAPETEKKFIHLKVCSCRPMRGPQGGVCKTCKGAVPGPGER